MANHTMGFHKAMHPLLRDGRKTQTRRVVKGVEGYALAKALIAHSPTGGEVLVAGFRADGCDQHNVSCPYEIGDTITVEGTDIRLTVTAIRCERLNDISARDCKAEGIRVASNGAFYSPILSDHITWSRPLAPFVATWGEIYPDGPKSWTANPTVWVVEFEKEQPNEH